MKFVRRKSKHGDRNFRQIDRHFSNGLSRIAMKRDPSSHAKVNHFNNRLNRANFVVAPHHRNKISWFGKSLFKFFKSYSPQLINWQKLNIPAKRL